MSHFDSARRLRNARRMIRIYAHSPDKDTASDVADAFEKCLDCPLKSLELRCCLAREAQRWRTLSGVDTPGVPDTPAQPAIPISPLLH